MMHEARLWLGAGLLGMLSGVLYWLVADQALGIGTSTLTERLVVGAMVGLALQVVRRLRHTR